MWENWSERAARRVTAKHGCQRFRLVRELHEQRLSSAIYRGAALISIGSVAMVYAGPPYIVPRFSPRTRALAIQRQSYQIDDARQLKEMKVPQ